MFMKRLPKNFVIMSRDYIEWKKWSIKAGGLTRNKFGTRVWYINETIAIYAYRSHAVHAGHKLAQAQKCGYIENIARGMKYTKLHRTYMYLYDR